MKFGQSDRFLDNYLIGKDKAKESRGDDSDGYKTSEIEEKVAVMRQPANLVIETGKKS